MSNNNIRDKIADYITNLICEDEDVGFCNSCPELKFCDDIGYYDCPHGLAVDSCEYFPQQEIDRLVDALVEMIEETRP